MKKRIVDERILEVLEKNRGIALTATQVQKLLKRQGHNHAMKVVCENLQLLKENNELWYFLKYGLPAQTKDGVFFLLLPPDEVILNLMEKNCDAFLTIKYLIPTSLSALTKLKEKIIKQGFPEHIIGTLSGLKAIDDALESGDGKKYLELSRKLIEDTEVEDVQERLLQKFPYIGVFDVLIRAGQITLEECAKNANLPPEKIVELLKIYRDTQ